MEDSVFSSIKSNKMNEVKDIKADIKRKILKPIYFLMGEESLFINEISDFIEENVLDESEKGFNQQIMYGRDVTIEEIIAASKRYPMMAERQVIIVKEAQDLSKNQDITSKTNVYLNDKISNIKNEFNFSKSFIELQNISKSWIS